MEDLHRLAGRLRRECPELELRENEPMAKYTTFRVGGPAALMALPKTEEEAQAALRAARKLGVEPFFLGNGSNLLVPDEGVDRFLIKPTGRYSVDPLNRVWEADGTLAAGGAVLLSRLAGAALDMGLTGLEFAGGIPGSVGGAATMNAGAYDGEMAQVVASVTALDRTGECRVFQPEECGFGYRRSAFSPGDWLITQVRFRLTPGDPASIRARMDDLTARRKKKQPLEFPSAGSTFKRPPGHFAAALIDQCGLKGLTVGGAQVSEKHAGFLINRGGATCADILELIDRVREEVLRQTGVELELEVRVLQ